MDCAHEWKCENEEIDCSLYTTRGSGQYNDPCYGISCPCDQGRILQTFVCTKCGEVKQKWDHEDEIHA